jgi:hypothetical protein
MVTKYGASGLFIILVLVHCITVQVNGVSPVPGKKVTTAYGHLVIIRELIMHVLSEQK